jgi:hypothetical protein
MKLILVYSGKRSNGERGFAAHVVLLGSGPRETTPVRHKRLESSKHFKNISPDVLVEVSYFHDAQAPCRVETKDAQCDILLTTLRLLSSLHSFSAEHHVWLL